MASHGPLNGGPRRSRVASLPQPSDPLRFPTQDAPRWRLRVFDRCWPWRATRGEALADAVASRNARRDMDDHIVYLDACANVQRDPPSRVQSHGI